MGSALSRRLTFCRSSNYSTSFGLPRMTRRDYVSLTHQQLPRPCARGRAFDRVGCGRSAPHSVGCGPPMTAVGGLLEGEMTSALRLRHGPGLGSQGHGGDRVGQGDVGRLRPRGADPCRDLALRVAAGTEGLGFDVGDREERSGRESGSVSTGAKRVGSERGPVSSRDSGERLQPREAKPGQGVDGWDKPLSLVGQLVAVLDQPGGAQLPQPVSEPGRA